MLNMKQLINTLLITSILLLLSTGVYAQSTADLIKEAAVVYVKPVSEVGVYVSTYDPKGISDWSSIVNYKRAVGDTVEVDDAFGQSIGSLLYYKEQEIEITGIANEKLQELLKSNLDPSVKFEILPEAAPDRYFELECMLNRDDAGQIVIGMNETEDSRALTERMSFSIVLRQHAPEFKRPKKILSVYSDGSYQKIPYLIGAKKEDLDKTMAEFMRILLSSAQEDLEKMIESKKKSISKKLSK